MLSGIKVLSFTHFLQGPSAVQMLADLGADVVKVEPAQGAWERSWAGKDAFLNGQSVFFMLANRNQRSLSLNLRHEDGLAVARKLASEADVIIENYRPGVMDRLGLGYETLKASNPGLVYCSCTGYGSSGPYVKRPGQDLLLQAMSGMAYLSGGADAPPTPVGSAIVDQHAAVLAAFGVLAALFERVRTGKGRYVESNLLNAALDLQIEPFCYYMNNGPLWDRMEPATGSRFHPAPYGVYQTRDGWIAVSLTPVEKLAVALDEPRFAEFAAGDQVKRRSEVHALTCEALLRRTTEDWMKVFDEHEIWFAPVNDYAQVVEDPQVRHNKVVLSMEHPKAGEVRVLAHPIRYDGQPPGLRRLPPEIGEHSVEVLREAGYGEADIERLLSSGAVKKGETA